MASQNQMVTLAGKAFVIVERSEFERLQALVRTVQDGDLPKLPEPDSVAKAELVPVSCPAGGPRKCRRLHWAHERPRRIRFQRTVRGFKIAHAELRASLAEAEGEVAGLRAELEQLPRRIPAAGLKILKTEKKLIVDTIKMTAYQVETQLLNMLNGVYCRNEDEGRTLLQAAFQSTARIEVREDELYVELAPQSSPHRTKAIAELCTKRNALGTKFPGTRLRLQLAIRPHEPLKSL